MSRTSPIQNLEPKLKNYLKNAGFVDDVLLTSGKVTAHYSAIIDDCMKALENEPDHVKSIFAKTMIKTFILKMVKHREEIEKEKTDLYARIVELENTIDLYDIKRPEFKHGPIAFETPPEILPKLETPTVKSEPTTEKKRSIEHIQIPKINHHDKPKHTPTSSDIVTKRKKANL